jgi:mannose/cellobiose epimerase-like protein (N-acyl-D-glucosamine 2-epimerase family)
MDGTVVDGARDAYDHAFIIFASAWYFRATGDRAAIAMADDAYAFMLTHLADPLHGGFFEEHPQVDRLPRRQNPHMHLLEATLAMYAATAAPKWLDASRQLVSLFESRLFDVSTGSLGEFFQRDWSAAEGAEGELREPGHQFEWVWLLNEHARASGDPDILVLADRLFEFGAAFGLASAGSLTGMVHDGVDRRGRLTAETSLLWPQTEYIKACVARCERGLPGMREAVALHVALLRAIFFRPDGANWCNQMSRMGECLSPVTPARVLYHVFLAIAEVIRSEEKIGNRR